MARARQRWMFGAVGMGALWLLPLLVWWVVRWSMDYQVTAGAFVVAIGLSLIPPVVLTWAWLYRLTSRGSAGPED